MFLQVQRLVSWLLIALLALIAGVGEGLHSLPGCGHALRVGQVTVLLGVSFPDSQVAVSERSSAEPGGTAASPHDGPDIPIRDEDLCPICSTIGHIYSAAGAPQFVLTMPLLDRFAAVISDNGSIARGRLFQARAPPLV